MVLKVVAVLMAIASYASVATSCPPLINCCAARPCNVFCCNCNGVCRKSFLLQSVLPVAKIEADNLDVAIKCFNLFDMEKFKWSHRHPRDEAS